MNRIKRLFCEKIKGEALEKLAEAFGCRKELYNSPEGYTAVPKGILDIQPLNHGKSVQIELEIKTNYFHYYPEGKFDKYKKLKGQRESRRRIVSYDELKEFLKD